MSKTVTPEEKLARAEKLHDMCGASFVDAREALEACDYDVLDAAVWLEQHGHAAPHAASYSTAKTETAQEARAMNDAQIAYEDATRKFDFGAAWGRFVEWLRRVLRKSIDISFVASRNGKQAFSVPLLLLVILAVFAFWVVIPLLVIGLFFNFRYHFDGVGAVTLDVNEWSRKASDGVDQLKQEFNKEN